MSYFIGHIAMSARFGSNHCVESNLRLICCTGKSDAQIILPTNFVLRSGYKFSTQKLYCNIELGGCWATQLDLSRFCGIVKTYPELLGNQDDRLRGWWLNRLLNG